MHSIPAFKNRTFIETLARLAVFVAIFMRVVIPQGFMIDSVQNGEGMKIVLCTAQGNVQAILNQNGDIIVDDDAAPNKHNKTADNSGNHCVFANGLADISINNANLNVQSVNWIIFNDIAANGIPQVGLGLAAPPPPKTGPPILI